uniref:Uncharacterized protein n=1 Tax=Meloidogyne incognita TaxID=6306 RepID=A0A914LP22_MELIC
MAVLRCGRTRFARGDRSEAAAVVPLDMTGFLRSGKNFYRGDLVEGVKANGHNFVKSSQISLILVYSTQLDELFQMRSVTRPYEVGFFDIGIIRLSSMSFFK